MAAMRGRKLATRTCSLWALRCDTCPYRPILGVLCQLTCKFHGVSIFICEKPQSTNRFIEASDHALDYYILVQVTAQHAKDNRKII